MSRSRYRNVFSGLGFAVLLALSAVSGCGPGFDSQVTGVVTLDGQPLTGGNVAFNGSRGAPGHSSIQSDGTYALTTTGHPGLFSGDYVVTVVSLGPPVMSTGGGMPSPGKLLVPAKYTSVETSDLKFNVTPGENKIDLQLRSK